MAIPRALFYALINSYHQTTKLDGSGDGHGVLRRTRLGVLLGILDLCC